MVREALPVPRGSASLFVRQRSRVWARSCRKATARPTSKRPPSPTTSAVQALRSRHERAESPVTVARSGSGNSPSGATTPLWTQRRISAGAF